MKKIALACEDNQGLNGQISQHFGRCPSYLMAEVEGSEVKKSEVVENPYYSNHIPGKVPQFIKEQGTHVMIAGGMGPKAIEMFSNFGIEVILGIAMWEMSCKPIYREKSAEWNPVSTITPDEHDHC